MGHPRQPRRAQVDRPAAHGPGGDGEADARRARPPRGDPQRRGRQAVADPHRRGREAVRGAARPRAPGRRRSCAPRASRRRSTPSSRRSTRAGPTRGCSATSTCRCCPQLAQGEANKILVIPSEFTQALGNIGGALSGFGANGGGPARGRSPAPAARAGHGPRRDRREGGRRRRRGGRGRARPRRPRRPARPRRARAASPPRDRARASRASGTPGGRRTRPPASRGDSAQRCP